MSLLELLGGMTLLLPIRMAMFAKMLICSLDNVAQALLGY